MSETVDGVEYCDEHGVYQCGSCTEREQLIARNVELEEENKMLTGSVARLALRAAKVEIKHNRAKLVVDVADKLQRVNGSSSSWRKHHYDAEKAMKYSEQLDCAIRAYREKLP